MRLLSQVHIKVEKDFIFRVGVK